MKHLLITSLAAFSLAGCSEGTEGTAVTQCDNDAVIMVVSGDTLDRARMGQYAGAIAKSGLYPKAKGYYLNAPKPIAVFEGDVPENHVTLMVRFPSLENAKAFWNSDAYQNDIKPIRLNPSAGNYTVTVYKEIDLPDYMQGHISGGGYTCE